MLVKALVFGSNEGLLQEERDVVQRDVVMHIPWILERVQRGGGHGGPPPGFCGWQSRPGGADDGNGRRAAHVCQTSSPTSARSTPLRALRYRADSLRPLLAYPWARSIARCSARLVYTRVRCRRYSAEAWMSDSASTPSVARAAACATASAVAACPCRARSVILAR